MIFLFQSTQSLRTATYAGSNAGRQKRFQSTQSLRTATFSRYGLSQRFKFQSTQSLRTATDCKRSYQAPYPYFNPRSPCGLRRWLNEKGLLERGNFNPRSPCGLRPKHEALRFKREKFQSTQSLRTATTSERGSKPPKQHFNPRSPCGLRHADKYQYPATIVISIHAVLADCDRSYVRAILRSGNFNPRSPCGLRPCLISDSPPRLRFQSTQSLRTATCFSRCVNRVR